MCGILGIASSAPIDEIPWFCSGRDAMAHRGPDDAGELWSDDRRVGLAHQRLAIQDLTSAGHQPMICEQGGQSIVFNGEIYNFLDLRAELEGLGHTFRSNGDTEVILAAYREWGTDCLNRFVGMFAFAVHDIEADQIFLARDRIGEKPLYYALSSTSLRFASELKALMADPGFERRVDRVALDCYLTLGFVPHERCMLAGVNKLPPAHAMLFNLDDGSNRIWRYWELPPEPMREEKPTAALHDVLLDELEALLERSVQQQLIADVPVGILLSGGVDSSLITAFATRANCNLKTFTVRFPGHQGFDETEHARLVASHFGTEHMELEAEESSVDILPSLARQFDEPMVDSSMIPTCLLSQLIRQQCPVALGGDGGDELFGGYRHHSRLLWMRQWLSWVPKALKGTLADVAGKCLPIGMKGRNWLLALGADLRTDLPLIAVYFDRRSRTSLLADCADWQFQAEEIRQLHIPRCIDLLQRATRTDFFCYLAEDILVKTDRASMLNSLEMRAPFLDYRIAEFAFGKVPAEQRTSPSERKILLKMLCKRVLPPQFDASRKQGFTLPLGAWLRDGPWKKFFEEVLLDSPGSLFNHAFVSGLLRGQAQGRDNKELLFALVLFELWRREYGVCV